MEKERFSITDLAEQFQVTSRTIRFYEDKGLITPSREGLTRIYSRSDRARLKLILRGRRLGFSLQDIKKMIDLYDPAEGSTEQLNYTLGKCKEQLEKLKVQRQDINEAIDELEDSISDLEDYLKNGAPAELKAEKKLA
ncbi:MerR family transcriptional regulator [Sneathiella glossodoripedis]|uniref:MerR family transcriptional regulator n=1 Tax=Sneathiella glossodoripedis TaxID=418853 RepID=UPI000472BC9D|nr:MerR family DNA-binding transcriptional regulator [Sneathiella glossodoripedis]